MTDELARPRAEREARQARELEAEQRAMLIMQIRLDLVALQAEYDPDHLDRLETAISVEALRHVADALHTLTE